MECKHCHRSVDEIDHYCRWCGYQLKEDHFKKRFYGLWAMIGVVFLLLGYTILFFAYHKLLMHTWMIQLGFFMVTLVILAISIVGIVHAVRCHKNLNRFYGLATSIVACSLAGCLLLCEMFLMISLWI